MYSWSSFRYLPVCYVVKLQYRRGLYWLGYSALLHRWRLRSCKGLHYSSGWWTISNRAIECKTINSPVDNMFHTMAKDSIRSHSGAKIHILSENSHFQNLFFFFFTKSTFTKSHFSQNSQFQNHILHKMTNLKSYECLDEKVIFAPVWTEKQLMLPRWKPLVLAHGTTTHF